MRKAVVIGGGLGLLVLALVAGSFWLASKNAESTVAAAPTRPGQSSMPPRATFPLPGGAAAPAAATDAGTALKSQQEIKERRRRLAEVRAEFNALRAQGANASPERMRAVVNELEALAPPGFDPRYYQTLRNMLESSARIQVLNKELQALSKSTAPKDVERQKILMDEMRVLGERVSAEARNLQAYAPKPSAGVKTP